MYQFEKIGSQTAAHDTASLFSSVLLVEDEAPHAKLIMRALEGLVGEVHHVSNGAEAIGAIESSFYELVFCDLHLGDISGLEVISAIRDARPGLPVVVMTASNDLNLAVAAMREGAMDYMLKQFSDDLRGRIELVISRIAEHKMQELRELKVRAERDAFWAAAHTAQDGLAILGAEGHVVFANEAFVSFCTQCDSTWDENASSNIIDVVRAQDSTVAGALAEQIHGKDGDTLWSSELSVKPAGADEKADPNFFDLAITSVKLGDLEDIPFGSSIAPELRRNIVWVRDITRKKEQEKFQRDLLSTTTHDLKGPLGAILTSAELLSDSKLAESVTEQGKALLMRIASCARNSITIIDELLSARRIQDGVLVVKPNYYNVNDCLDDAVLDYLPLAKAKDIKLVHMQAPSKLEVYADKMSLMRVLGNLVSNAIKFTPDGGRVELSGEQGSGEVRLSVADSGPGIESNARHLLFERYARLDKHQNIEGTGLGLYVTKNIVDAHNGHVEVQSEVGVGTTFVVAFPDKPKED